MSKQQQPTREQYLLNLRGGIVVGEGMAQDRAVRAEFREVRCVDPNCTPPFSLTGVIGLNNSRLWNPPGGIFVLDLMNLLELFVSQRSGQTDLLLMGHFGCGYLLYYGTQENNTKFQPRLQTFEGQAEYIVEMVSRLQPLLKNNNCQARVVIRKNGTALPYLTGNQRAARKILTKAASRGLFEYM